MKMYIVYPKQLAEKYKDTFNDLRDRLVNKGFTILDPSTIPESVSEQEHLHICKAMIDVADIVVLMTCLGYTKEAKPERQYATEKEKPFLIGLDEALPATSIA